MLNKSISGPLFCAAPGCYGLNRYHSNISMNSKFCLFAKPVTCEPLTVTFEKPPVNVSAS